MASTRAAPLMLDIAPATARRLSVVVGVAIVGGLIAHAVPHGLLVASLLKVVGLAGALALFVSPFGAMANAPDALLDERERLDRATAFIRAHQLIVGALFVAVIAGIVAQASDRPLPSGEAAFDLLTQFAIVALAVPGVILAWRTPTSID